jgi:hypothetical protein
MFSGLFDFGLERSSSQAVGFYCAYLLVSLLIATLVSYAGAAMITLPSDEAALYSARFGAFISLCFCLALTYLLLRGKGMLRSPSAFVYLIAVAILTFFGGGLFGLIVTAYLSTRAKVGVTISPSAPHTPGRV